MKNKIKLNIGTYIYANMYKTLLIILLLFINLITSDQIYIY